MLPKKGQCCGECIQKSCTFKNQTYQPGDVWRSEDKCLYYECADIFEGINVGAKVTSYKKSCPKLENCPSNEIYFEDCCPVCRTISSTENDAIIDIFANNDEVMSRDTYLKHPCRRECIKSATPKTCNYKFVVSLNCTLIILTLFLASPFRPYDFEKLLFSG